MLQNSLHSQPNKVLGLNKFKITMQGSHNTKGSIKHFLRFKTFISWLRQDWEIQHYNLYVQSVSYHIGLSPSFFVKIRTDYINHLVFFLYIMRNTLYMFLYKHLTLKNMSVIIHYGLKISLSIFIIRNTL